ncbi:MAG: type IV secretion system DNA-binding domain-containing protein [Patescibacteria group bacterium]|nr:type IV secretion system DNA-binding domain-containing protein [Patescibacteria group bacterium]
MIVALILVVLVVSVWLAVRGYKKPSGFGSSFENIVLRIRVPKENEKDALAAEQMFSSLHGLLRLTPEFQEHIGFEITASSAGINFFAVCPKGLKDFVESQVYAQYPNAELTEVPDYTVAGEDAEAGVFAHSLLVLSKPSFFPIRTFKEFEVDPLSGITGAISKLHEKEQVWLQLLIRPVPDVWQQEGHDYVNLVRSGARAVNIGLSDLGGTVSKEIKSLPYHFFKAILSPGTPHPLPDKAAPVRTSSGDELAIKSIDLKLSKLGFETNLRVLVRGESREQAENRLRGVLASFKQFSTANLNSFMPLAAGEGPNVLSDYSRRLFDNVNSYVLTTEELASVFHLPSVSVETPAIAWTPAKRAEPPSNLPTQNCTYLGKTTFRESMIKFGIKREDRTRHFYVVGKTGSGKTTVFKNMIIQDMRNGEGLCVLDPHGDLIEEMLNFVPEQRLSDVVILDPSDVDHPTSLNMLEISEPMQKNLMASGLVDAFKKHFIDSWGPRLEYILNNSILTLLEVPRTTLLGITRLLTDDNYQKYIVYKVKDPVIKAFWEKEFREMKGNQKLITEAIAPIQNKVGRFLSSSTIRNIVGQAKSTIDLEEIMNSGKILFVNLAKGRIGEDNSNLLGSLIISRLQFTAMQRVKVPEEKRRDFYVYADEFQNFASGSFASILSEARKYKLCLNLTHQYTAQLPKPMLEAIFGNVGTMMAFALGAPDAKALALEFAPFTENDLISLERHHVYVKLMIDSMTSAPFSAVTLPVPSELSTGNRDKVVELSRSKYGVDRMVVEGKINQWVERQFTLGLAKAEEMREPGSPSVEIPEDPAGSHSTDIPEGGNSQNSQSRLESEEKGGASYG